MHTPGPWKTETWEYRNPKNEKYKRLVPVVISPRRKMRILAVDSDEGKENPYTIPLDEAKANARLIAAAPDLLLALETCLKNTEMRRASGFESGPMIDYEIEIARAAIAKATGKTD
jgi:hypothetical protein